MNRRMIVLLAIGMLVLPTVIKADTPKAMTEVLNTASGSMVMMKCSYLDDIRGQVPMTGQCMCIDASGIFVTNVFEPTTQAAMIQNVTIVLPGVEKATLLAELMGIDPISGLGFIKAAPPAGRQWTPIKFAAKSEVIVGKQVTSLGLLSQDTGYAPYVGVAYVSTKVRVPSELIYVTGGKLTNIGSPVYAAEKPEAIGVVGRQMFLDYQTPTKQGPTPLLLQNMQETAFFTPVEEFGSSLAKENWPDKNNPRRLPWMGVNMAPVSDDQAKLAKLDVPAVMIDRVFSGYNGDKAGLKERDMIIAVGDKPLERLATPELVVQNFVRQVARMPVGEKLNLTVLRGDAKAPVTLTLESSPMRPDEAKRYYSDKLGLWVREKVDMDKYMAPEYIANTPGGLVVIGVVDKSPAATDGLAGNDLILKIGEEPVSKVDTLKAAIDAAVNATPPKSVVLVVRRGPDTRTITIRPPR